MYPRPHNNKPIECPYCHKETYRWQATFFSAFYHLGDWFCDDPDCKGSFKNKYKVGEKKDEESH